MVLRRENPTGDCAGFPFLKSQSLRTMVVIIPRYHDREMLVLFHALLGLALFVPSLLSGPVRAGEALSIEVFTTPGFPISGKGDPRLPREIVTVHYVDGLEQFESALSEGLPNDAGAAKAEALRRIADLNDARVVPAKESAMAWPRPRNMVSTTIPPSSLTAPPWCTA